MTLRARVIAAAALVLLCAGLTGALEYKVTVKRVNNGEPVLNSKTGESTFMYNYNPSYIPLFATAGAASPTQDALLVRCQNLSAGATSQYDVGRSVVALVNRTGGPLTPSSLGSITFAPNSDKNIVLSSEGDAENYGVEDPRVVYRPADRTYYLMYSAVQQYPNNVTARLALATSEDGSTWVRHGPVFPDIRWSKSGSLLIRDGAPGPSLLFWGDSSIVPGMQLAVAEDDSLLHWRNLPGIWLDVRPESFDSTLVRWSLFSLLDMWICGSVARLLYCVDILLSL